MAEEPALLVQGPRAVGKTTLLEGIAARTGRQLIDLSDDEVRAVASEDARAFLSGREIPILIDEYQRLPELLAAVKYEVDHRRSEGLFVLTGSTTADLLPRGTESLAGRMHDVTLWGFSQGEILGMPERFVDLAFSEPEAIRRGRSTEDRSDYVAMAVRGGFPEAVARERESSRVRWLRGYASRVVERDLSELVSLRSPQLLDAVLQSCMVRTAQVLNVADIANDLRAQRETVGRYLDLLERVFLIERLPAYSRNRTTRLARHPKIHATDTGLAAALAGFDSSSLRESTTFGAMLETFVVGELRKQIEWSETDVRLFHFREHNTAEVDVVMESWQGTVVGVEVKSSRSVSRSDLRGLERLADLAGSDFVHGYVLYTGDTGLQLGDDPRFSAVPVAALWRA